MRGRDDGSGSGGGGGSEKTEIGDPRIVRCSALEMLLV